MNDTYVRIRKMAVVICFIVLSRQSPKKTEENHENYDQHGWWIGRDSNKIPPEYKSEEYGRSNLLDVVALVASFEVIKMISFFSSS
jgi:hypothetical protein